MQCCCASDNPMSQCLMLNEPPWGRRRVGLGTTAAETSSPNCWPTHVLPILESTVDSPAGHVTDLTSTQCYHPGPGRLRPCQTPGFRAQRWNAASLASSFQCPTLRGTWQPTLLRLVLHWQPPPARPCSTAEMGRGGGGVGVGGSHPEVFTPVLYGPALAVRQHLLHRQYWNCCARYDLRLQTDDPKGQRLIFAVGALF